MALPILDLALQDFRDGTTIALVDLSSYVSTPDSSHLNLQITPPGYPTIAVSFTPNNVNVYKCADLGITCGDTGCTPLPDGIWDVVYTVIPAVNQSFSATTVERKFIKIDQIKCLYETTFNKVDLECLCYDHEQEKYIKELYRIKLFIDGSVSACNKGNYVLSADLYQRALYLLTHICCRFGIPHSTCGFTPSCKIC